MFESFSLTRDWSSNNIANIIKERVRKIMMKYLEKTLYFGLGLVTYSAEKIEALVNELVKKGEVASEDAKKLVNELIEKGEKQKEAIRKYIQEEISKMQDEKETEENDGPVTRDEIRRIIKEELSKMNEQKETDEPREVKDDGEEKQGEV